MPSPFKPLFSFFFFSSSSLSTLGRLCCTILFFLAIFVHILQTFHQHNSLGWTAAIIIFFNVQVPFTRYFLLLSFDHVIYCQQVLREKREQCFQQCNKVLDSFKKKKKKRHCFIPNSSEFITFSSFYIQKNCVSL